MGRAHQNAGHAKDAAELYKRYLARAKNLDHRAQGLVLLAQAQIKIGDERGADASLDGGGEPRQAAAARDLGPDGKYAAAHARYMQGERVLAKFEKIQIQGDVKQLKARLKQKTELLKEAAKVLLDCVSMGVAEWTTAALYQIGHMYEAFAQVAARLAAAAGGQDRGPEVGLPVADRGVRRPHGGAEPRRVRERLEGGEQARHLQPVDGQDARRARPPEQRALSALQGDGLRGPLAGAPPDARPHRRPEPRRRRDAPAPPATK